MQRVLLIPCFRVVTRKTCGRSATAGMSDVAAEMCDALYTDYVASARTGALPHVLLFDGDSFCAMNLAEAFGIARVARVGAVVLSARVLPPATL